MFEKLADRIGRDIRYGAPPSDWLSKAELRTLDPRLRRVYDLTYELRDLTVEQSLLIAALIAIVEQDEIDAPDAPETEQSRRSVAANLRRLRRHIESLDD